MQSSDFCVIAIHFISDKMIYQTFLEGIQIIYKGGIMVVALHDPADKSEVLLKKKDLKDSLNVVSLLKVSVGPCWTARTTASGSGIVLDLR